MISESAPYYVVVTLKLANWYAQNYSMRDLGWVCILKFKLTCAPHNFFKIFVVFLNDKMSCQFSCLINNVKFFILIAIVSVFKARYYNKKNNNILTNYEKLSYKKKVKIGKYSLNAERFKISWLIVIIRLHMLNFLKNQQNKLIILRDYTRKR